MTILTRLRQLLSPTPYFQIVDDYNGVVYAGNYKHSADHAWRRSVRSIETRVVIYLVCGTPARTYVYPAPLVDAS